MNRGFHIALFIAFALFSLLQVQSCSKADRSGDGISPIESDEYSGGPVSIKARIEDSMHTKVDYTSSGTSVWNGGDVISVFAIDTSGVFYRNLEFFSIQDGNEITFTGNVPKGYKLIGKAVYPYSGKHLFGSTDDGIVFAAYISSGTNEKIVGAGPNPMIGVLEQDGTYVFRHCTGALRLTLSNMPSGDLTVRLQTKEYTVGRYEVDTVKYVLDYTHAASTDNTYNVKVHADDFGNATAYFPLAESTYSGLVFTVMDANGDEVMSQEFPGKVSIRKGEFQDLSMEFKVDTSADFSRWFDGTEYENYRETVDLAQHGQLLNGCDTLFLTASADTLYGYISVNVKTTAIKNQLRYLRVFIDHKDDQTTEFNPTYDIGWIDLPQTPKQSDGPHADLLFEGSIYQSGKIRKVQDNEMTLYRISPGENPTESWGWAGGITKGNGTHETIDHGFTGSGVFEDAEEGGRFRYQFEIARDVALITEDDLKGYSLGGTVTGKVNVMVVVSDKSYSASSICPDRGGTDLQLL